MEALEGQLENQTMETKLGNGGAKDGAFKGRSGNRTTLTHDALRTD